MISRVLDGVATPEDWRSLEAEASADPAVWMRLAQTFQAQSLLGDELKGALASVESVELPRARAPRLLPRWSSWAGWAAAAAVALTWVGVSGFGSGAPALHPQTGETSTGEPLASSAPLENLTEPDPTLRLGAPEGHSLGELVGELPAVMVDARPAADGNGQDVYYMRRIVERARVNQMFQVNRNELGQPVAVPVGIGPVIPRPPL